jgi:type IV pilus assembly protein PilA
MGSKTNGAPSKRAEGFTLIEVMIVVAIIGILASIAIPNFLRFQLKAKSSEAKINLGAIRTLETAYDSAYSVFVACAASPAAAPGPRVPYAIATPGEGFELIGWEPEGSVYFRYSVTTNATSTVFTASAQANIDDDANLQSWGYVKPALGTIVGVAGAGPCADTGVWNASTATATLLDQVGPCDATSGQSVF